MEVKVQACFKFNVINPFWRNKVCDTVVPSCTSFLVPVLHAGCLCYYKALSQFVQFVGERDQLLECSPASCLALQNHCEEKSKKFITRRINNKLPSYFSFDTGTVSNFEKPARAYFFHLSAWKTVLWGKTSLFERHTILSHLPGTLKVFWWLTYPFLCNNVTLFISRRSARVYYQWQTCAFCRKRKWILASKMLASFSR